MSLSDIEVSGKFEISVYFRKIYFCIINENPVSLYAIYIALYFLVFAFLF